MGLKNQQGHKVEWVRRWWAEEYDQNTLYNILRELLKMRETHIFLKYKNGLCV